MKLFVALLALTGAVMGDLNKWGCETKDGVCTLTKGNFDEFIKKNKYVFVKFYAPWCGHCKSMAPSYAKLAEKMNAQADGIPIAELDATENGEVAEKYGVQGYPTLKFFVDGEAIDYSGEREGPAIEAFINKKINPSSKALTKPDDFKELETAKLAGVLVTAEANKDQLKIFNQFSTAYETQFYNAAFAEALALTGSTGKYNFVVYRNFDEGKKVLSSDKHLTAEELKNFWESLRHPTLMEFDQETAEKIFGGEETSVFLFTDDTTSATIDLFSEVAKEKKGALIFCKSTIKGGLGERLSEYLGITEKDENTAVIVHFEGGNPNKYKLPKWDKPALAEFIDDFKSGTLKPFFKSNPIPESNSDPVKVIVGHNFEVDDPEQQQARLARGLRPLVRPLQEAGPDLRGARQEGRRPRRHRDRQDGRHHQRTRPRLHQGLPHPQVLQEGRRQNPLDFDGDRTLEGFLAFLEKETGKKLTDGRKDEQPVDESL